MLFTPYYVYSRGITYRQPAPNHDHSTPSYQQGDSPPGAMLTAQPQPLILNAQHGQSASRGPRCSHVNSAQSLHAWPTSLMPIVISTSPGFQAPRLAPCQDQQVQLETSEHPFTLSWALWYSCRPWWVNQTRTCSIEGLQAQGTPSPPPHRPSRLESWGNHYTYSPGGTEA